MKPYPVYKESGVEWLGSLPEGWRATQLKRFALMSYGDALASEIRDESGGVAVYGSNGPVGWHNIGNTHAPALLIGRKGSFGALNWSERACFAIDTVYFVDYHLASCDLRWLYWAMHNANFDALSQDTGVPGLSRSLAHDTWFALPPLPEQQAIAAFLDRETAKIDGLIEEQRRLIALLAEKRQATISHAVTRGLNPSARLKPSGVEWLGDVPEGWEVVRLKDCVVENGGIQMGPFGGMLTDLLFQPADYKVYGQENVTNRDVQRGSRWIDEERYQSLSSYSLRKGDLMLTRKGTVGNCFMFPEGAQPGIIDSDTIRIRIKCTDLDADYALTILHGAEYVSTQINLTKRGAILSGLNTTVVSNLIILRPPMHEQGELIEFIHESSRKLDALTEVANSAIVLLQERRAALISAAVTGKIDVRDAQASTVQTRKSLSVSVLLGGVIIAALGRHASMGRMLVQKHLFMAEAHAGVYELQGAYDRQAAGPYDADLQHQVEADLVAAGLLRVAQDGGPGSRVDYEFLGDAAALRAELALALGDRMARFDDAFRQLADLSKSGIEAVATLYAAWNDFLMDGKSPSRGDIICEVLENWHPEKRKKFTKADLETWLDWMERHQILPTGTGPKTQTGRLFP